MSQVLSSVTDADFDRVVARAVVPVLVLFWKPGCGHCHVLRRELEQLQHTMGKQLLVLTMNVEEQYQIPAELEITSLPALALYQGGIFVRFIGGLGKQAEIRAQLARERL